MKTNKGFSLVELVIVIAIIGILASISSFAWRRSVDNSNLRTAARMIVSDFLNCKQNAIRENRPYTIAFTPGGQAGDVSSYAITAAANGVLPSVNIITGPNPENSAGITITEAAFGNSQNITFQTRGTCSSGHVNLTNLTGSTARITSNITGKTFITFTMR